jgi:predicted HTH transcriptional regulator
MGLNELLRQPEGKTLEFKRDLSSPQGVLRTIVAFANTAGGTVVIGVEDRTRHVRGVSEPLAMEERLASLIADRIQPRIVPDLEILPWRRSHVLAIRVHPSPIRPHHLAGLGPEEGILVRVGSTNRRADAPLIAELRRYALGSTFDEEPIADLGSEAIDFRAASESFVSIRTLRPGDLRTLGLVVLHQGRRVPTVGGMLLFGLERQERFPDAWIQVGRFAGSDKRRIIDSAEIRTHLAPAVEDALTFVRRNIAREAIIGEEARRADRWAFPLVAVREAIINAVVHADYSQIGSPIRVSIFSDRLEVENPGLLPLGLTIDDIHRGISKLRNRVIGRVFHALGLIEQWGSGVQRMVGACADAGLKPPFFEEIGTHFRVTLSSDRQEAARLDDVDQAIVTELETSGGLSTKDLSKRIARSPRATRSRLAGLVERGIVVEVGSSPNDPRRRYYLASPDRP